VTASSRSSRDTSISSAHDPRSLLPTVATAIDGVRNAVQETGLLVVYYLTFDRFDKVEEIYGWEKLDAVLDTTARELSRLLVATPLHDARLMVSYLNDDDFVLLHIPSNGSKSEDDIETMTRELQQGICTRLESAHGTDIASLFDLYVGRALVYVDPKARLERQIYRGIREAAGNARNVEQRDRVRLIEDLRETLRTRAVYVDYHPIVSADDGRVFGYEALARGSLRSLRRPEVMFEIAAEAGLLWELSRLCRERAVDGMRKQLSAGELLFINIDPHDFQDPAFGESDLDVPDPRQVVIEITERTAIKNYPEFRERLRAFRERGYRFAVDDAGSGYAGLGSIANLEPDFIKLDLSLITGIDTNFIKQDLVESIVRFANDQGARVTAEGVEQEAEYEMVKTLGVHFMQGFFLHRPQQAPHDLDRPVDRPTLL
jgi:EAL domain-containing protein (putative c-di-GMP-specific phosphodiesterase class I)/GGDEF domain-containing protein